MDYFGRERLKELLEAPDGPAVSIYLPTHRSSSEAEQDRLRFRAALDRARELLSTDYAEGEFGPLLEDLEPLARDPEFWRYQAEGLAVFVADAFHRMYRVPTELPELVVVGPSFHTRPLIEYLQMPDRFWVLALGQKKVRLWQGNAAGLTPMDLKGLPRSLTDALGFEFERDEKLVMRRKEGDGTHGQHGRGGIMPVFHGHGVGPDDSEPELRRFFRAVDDGLRDLLEDEIGPLVLAAVKEHHSLYRSVSRLDNLVDEGIEASVMDWDEERLHREAWPIAKKTALEKVERALELWENSYGRGKGEGDLANLGRLAVAGRLRLLLTERDRRIWGTLDRETGRLEILQEGGDDPGNQAVDLLDELAELVMLRGGRALVLSEGRMPTETGAAGVLR